MVDETTLQLKTSRAFRAKTLLEDDLLKGAFIQLRHDYQKAWEGTDVRDTDLRERLWLAIRIVSMVEKHFKVAIENGKLAQRDLDELERDRKRKRLRII